MIFYLLIFLISSMLLTFSGKWLVDAISKIAKFLGWKEFVVAFFLMAFSVSISNFFVGIISALNKIPELSFGDVIGGNVIALTLLVGLGALISKTGLSAPSRTVQRSSIFTILIAILPIILVSDGVLSRSDGFLLILAFLGYIFWLFIKKERFAKIYDDILEPLELKFFFKKFCHSFSFNCYFVFSCRGDGKISSLFCKLFKSSTSFNRNFNCQFGKFTS